MADARKDIGEKLLTSVKKRAVSAISHRSESAIAGRMRNFNKMTINELKQHEKGILNLYESQQALAKMISHNKNENGEGNIFDIKLT